MQFLDLPPEIRNQIYHFIESVVPAATSSPSNGIHTRDGGNCVDCNRILAFYNPTPPGWTSRVHDGPRMRILQPNISKTCRTLRAETLPIFYGANKYLIADLYDPRLDGLQVAFTKIVWDFFSTFKDKLPLMRDVVISSNQRIEQDIVAGLRGSEFDFQPGVLRGLQKWKG